MGEYFQIAKEASKAGIVIGVFLSFIIGGTNYLANHNTIQRDEKNKTITYSKIDNIHKYTKITTHEDGSNQIFLNNFISGSKTGIDSDGDSNLDFLIIKELDIFKSPNTYVFSKNDGRQVSKDTLNYFNKIYEEQLKRFEPLINSASKH